MQFSLALTSSLLSLVAATGDLALYWGQASAGSERSLGDYCQNTAGDIYIISFITTFGSGREIGMNIAGYYDFFPGTQLLNASALGQQIETCQGLGKKVLISLGGASGSYGFDSDSDAKSVAQDLWNYFGGGESSTRPFGDAKIDGFDLDGENNIDAEYYVPFVNELRQLYSQDSSKQYYVSAAPQCPYPDATLGQAIAKADLDYLFIQFYNNYCSLSGSSFNYDTWQSFATDSSPNKNVKLFVGLPGSTSAAGSGYVTIDQIKSDYPEFSNTANFGGFMVWDASQADQNKVGDSTFGAQLKSILDGSSSASSSASSLTSSSTSSSPSATPPSSTVLTTSSTSSTVLTTSSAPHESPAASTSYDDGSYHSYYDDGPYDDGSYKTSYDDGSYHPGNEGAGFTKSGAPSSAVSTAQVLVANGNTTATSYKTYYETSSCTTSTSSTPAGEPVHTSYDTSYYSAGTTSTPVGQPAQTLKAEANGKNTVLVTSTVQSVVSTTNTITNTLADPTKVTSPAEESCYTISGEVVVVKTAYATQYTTVWV